MAEQKTKKTGASVEGFLKKVADKEQREDAFKILAMMKEVTGRAPRMWGPSMVGFGECHYKYASGHEGDCFLIGFAPRKGKMSLYFMPGVGRFAAQLRKLGKHKTGKGCLYINKLADVNEAVLREMIETAYAEMVELVQSKRAEAGKKKGRSRSG